MRTLALLQPWPSWKCFFVVLVVSSGNMNDVELVQLQPWPSGKLSMSILQLASATVSWNTTMRQLPKKFSNSCWDHHQKLWDPGGIHSLAWICPWRMVLVNFNCILRAQINEDFHWGTSLDLVAYRGYPALTLASTCPWEHLWYPVTIPCNEQTRFHVSVLSYISPGVLHVKHHLVARSLSPRWNMTCKLVGWM
jgi:hypothetical protein